MEYSYTKKLKGSFTEIVEKTKEVLAGEGFGILTEIDVKATLKQKMDVEYDEYLILGVCNPALAYKALQMEKKVGLLMPCNVVVYAEGDVIRVSAIKPTEAMGIIENEKLAEIAGQAENKLRRVMDRL